MITARANPLAECGKPLFFKHDGVDGVCDSGVAAPPPRRGDSVRLYAQSLAGMQKEALAVSGRTGIAWRLASDEGAYLAGLDEAPCPLAFLTTGMISSYMNEILALARARGISLGAIRLIQDNYYTMVGSALRGTMTGGARNVRLTAQIASDADRTALMHLVFDAVVAAPLNGLMRGQRESLFTLTHNGREIETRRAVRLGRPAEPDRGELLDESRPAAGDWSNLIRRGGMTPRAAHTVTLANDSLAERQNRLLHVRGICTLADGGLKHIEQHIYNPHGSVFHFLSDEAPGDGGAGRAPDALSYISAGIGFCFMTQLGRFAAIAEKDLRRCRIVQDTHFSLGGASGGTGRAGEADPVETHVHLETGEDDDFARTILDIGEQTCFLHALCKTDLKTRICVQEYSADAAIPAPCAFE